MVIVRIHGYYSESDEVRAFRNRLAQGLADLFIYGEASTEFIPSNRQTCAKESTMTRYLEVLYTADKENANLSKVTRVLNVLKIHSTMEVIYIKLNKDDFIPVEKEDQE